MGMRRAYSALFTLLLPLVLLRLLIKSRRLPAYRRRLLERLAIFSTPPVRSPDCLWIHAVSVGECEAAFPLVKTLLERHKSVTVVMTCTTPTGSSRIQSVLGDRVQHVYLPYDLPAFARRFFAWCEPRLAIFMETELWPNFLDAAAQRSVPVVIVNGRLSEKSVRGYQKLQSLMQPAFCSVTRVLAQSEADALRYRTLGVDAGSVVVTGNLKYDMEWSEAHRNDSLHLRGTLFGQRPVLVAGSTHPGEEAQVLVAFKELLADFENAVLVLAPRHPERAADVMSLVSAMGLSALRRSSGQRPEPHNSVLLIDGVGELRRFYGASDVAFVGGSLIPHGGQNPLEPLACGIPVLFGPNMHNFRDISEKILSAGAGRQVSDAKSLSSTLRELLLDTEKARTMGRAGLKLIDENRGALALTCRALDPLLPSYSSQREPV